MKNSFNAIGILILIWIGLGSGAVNALAPGPIDSNFVDNGTTFNANFGNDAVTASFADHFTFTADPPMFGAGGTSVISGFSLAGFEVHFDTFELWDVTTSTLVAPGTIVAGDFVGFSNFSALTSGHDYDIIVTGGLNFGHTSGGYSGNISISPVPEPEIYTMLLIGLGLVGFAARKSRNPAYGLKFS